jgi:hypothetical protein
MLEEFREGMIGRGSAKPSWQAATWKRITAIPGMSRGFGFKFI